MQSNCENCKNVYYDHFCSYESRHCYIHGWIDCNPDSYLNTLKGEKCPDFTDKNECILQEIYEDQLDVTNVVLPPFDSTKFLF